MGTMKRVILVGLAIAAALLVFAFVYESPAPDDLGRHDDRPAPVEGAEDPVGSTVAPESAHAAPRESVSGGAESALVVELRAVLATRPETAEEWTARAGRLVEISNAILALPAAELGPALRGVAVLVAESPDFPKRTADVERLHLALNLLRRATGEPDRTLDGKALWDAIGPVLAGVLDRKVHGRPFRAAGLVLARVGHPAATAVLVKLARREGAPSYIDEVRDDASAPLLLELAREQHHRMGTQHLVPALVYGGEAGRAGLRSLIDGLSPTERAGEWKAFVERAEWRLEEFAKRGRYRPKPLAPWPDPASLGRVLEFVMAEDYGKAGMSAKQDRLLEIPDRMAAKQLLSALRESLPVEPDRRSYARHRALERLLSLVRPKEVFVLVSRAVAEDLVSAPDRISQQRCDHFIRVLVNTQVLDQSEFADILLPVLEPYALTAERTVLRGRVFQAITALRTPRTVKLLLRCHREFETGYIWFRGGWPEPCLPLLVGCIRERRDYEAAHHLCRSLSQSGAPGRVQLRALLTGATAMEPENARVVVRESVSALAGAFRGAEDLVAIEAGLESLGSDNLRENLRHTIPYVKPDPEIARAVAAFTSRHRGASLETSLYRMLARWPPASVDPVLDDLTATDPVAQELLGKLRTRVERWRNDPKDGDGR
jgi:hypothetical protein